MTQAVSNPTLLQRVIHVAVVALCTASSLALLGAGPAAIIGSRKKDVSASAKAAPAPLKLAAVARVAEPRPQVELRVVDTDEEPTPTITVEPEPRTRVIRMEVTAYCPCTKCCGPNAQGITASGKPVSYNGGKFVAADTRVLPFGKKLVIPGYADEAQVEVIDRGGAIKGNKLDLYFPTHAEALVWGRQRVDVTVYE